MATSPLTLSPALSLSAAGSSNDDIAAKHAKIAKAASQFEALLIGEMLKSVREASDDGWLGGGTDSSAESAFGIAETQLAQTLADHGGFGLAKKIQKSLEADKRVARTLDGSQ